MDLINKKVKHKTFGSGIIKDQKESYIYVQFNSLNEIKTFIYPSCFKTFLELIDEDVSIEVEELVLQEEEKKKQKELRAIQEANELQYVKKVQTAKKNSKTVFARQFYSVDDFCNTYKNAISAEVLFLKNNGEKKQHIFDGKFIEQKNSRFIYYFETEDELNYPEGTQINIWCSDTSITGNVIGCEDFTIFISISKYLGNDVPALEFSAESWRLLNSLSDRLDEMKNNPSTIVKSIICDGRKSIEYGNTQITTGQANAAQMSETQPITFIWGPPGAGKTQTLAKIALSHIKHGHRILMLSYSNVSVDGAIMRVHEMASDLRPGTIVRYGYAKQQKLLDHEYLTSYNLAIHNNPKLYEERKTLIAEGRRLSKTSQRYTQIKRRLAQIRDELTLAEKQTVSSSMFVATTISKTIVDSVFRNCNFDVVIFDEASMAYIPQIVFAASLAKKHFICMGDFKQLPPIVQSSDTTVLNADIFQYCGIADSVEGGRNHKWLCMLDTQYRMHSSIADFSSKTMYRGLLHTADKIDKEREHITKCKPVSGHPIVLADLSGMMSVCTKTGDFSRVNVLSALVSFSFAIEIAKSYEVGIITPYRTQSRLLHAMARDVSEIHPEIQPISCATVHQFQGAEKDAIIYDAVDCYRMNHPGKLLTSTGNNYANRLFNVAVTRARGKFVSVSNLEFMERKHLSSGLVFSQMIDKYRISSSCIGGQEITHKHTVLDNTMTFFDQTDDINLFLSDILSSHDEIRIDLPDRPKDNDNLIKIVSALNTAKSKGIKVFIRAENKQNLPAVLKSLAIENQFVANPITVIDKKIIWFGMPFSDAEFKIDKGNIPTKHRPIIRFEGKHTAKSIYGFMEMSQTIDQSSVYDSDDEDDIPDNFATYVQYETRCPKCGKSMRLKKSRKGKFFLSCSNYPNCDGMEWVDVDLVNDYFYYNDKKCPICNSPLEALVGQYGLYIRCDGYNGHKYKLDEI